MHEPMERVAIDVPDEYLGVVTQLLALRLGRLVEMVNHGTGWVRMDYRVPARGLVGFRTEFVIETRGHGHPAPRLRRVGTVARRAPNLAQRLDGRRPDAASTTTYALMALQERGTMLVGPGTEVYEGMIVGENSRADEMDVNPTKEKKLTNVRSSTAEELERLTPPLAAVAGAERSSSSPRTSASRSRRRPCVSARSSSTRPSEDGCGDERGRHGSRRGYRLAIANPRGLVWRMAGVDKLPRPTRSWILCRSRLPRSSSRPQTSTAHLRNGTLRTVGGRPYGQSRGMPTCQRRR